jgi:hypothetical protein
MKRITLAVVLVLAACGGGTDTATDSQPDTTEPPVTTTAASVTTSADPTTTTVAATEAPEATGSEGITLVIGDKTWGFERAMCAYYDAPAGEPGSRWNVSSIQNNSFSSPDIQVYVNWEDPDTYLSLNDFVSGEEWNAQKDSLTIEVDGDEITATATFASGAGETAEGHLSAICQSWVAAG